MKRNNWNFKTNRISSSNGSDMNIDKDDMSKQKKERYAQDTQSRKLLEKWATRLISVYLCIVAFILCSNGFLKVIFNLLEPPISDKVMIVMLSTTIVNIIGLGAIVLKGHFNKDNN